MALGLALSAATLLARPAAAQETVPETESDAPPESLGMDPAAPTAQALPGGMAPLLGEPAGPDWRFDFHGVIRAPLNVGTNRRQAPGPGQSKLVLHTPPQVPGDLATFSHTGVTPMPYVQLNFSYGNDIVTGTAILLARQVTVASAFFDPPSQSGINDLFLTVVPKLGDRSRLTIRVGALTNRYGSPGEYDEGRYGTPLIARTNGVGEDVEFAHTFGALKLSVAQGFQGQITKAGNGMVSEGWNDFADPGVGSSFVNHFHAGVGYKKLAALSGHYLLGWSQDDRAGVNAVDGRLHVFGADLRLTLGRFGHFFGAYARVNADHVRSVGRTLEILNTRDGPGLMQHYLGPSEAPAALGTGTMNIFGAQYDLSIGRLVSYPVPFSGDGPDIYVSLFGMMVQVQSEDKTLDPRPRLPTEGPADKLYDNVTKLKYGAEATYSFLPWMAAGLRYDAVAPVTREQKRSFVAISPRLMFHTGWQSRDLVMLQYTRFMYGAFTEVPVGYPPKPDIFAAKDENVFSLSANMWW
jgi:hypothetical protein